MSAATTMATNCVRLFFLHQRRTRLRTREGMAPPSLMMRLERSKYHAMKGSASSGGCRSPHSNHGCAQARARQNDLRLHAPPTGAAPSEEQLNSAYSATTLG